MKAVELSNKKEYKTDNTANSGKIGQNRDLLSTNVCKELLWIYADIKTNSVSYLFPWSKAGVA